MPWGRQRSVQETGASLSWPGTLGSTTVNRMGQCPWGDAEGTFFRTSLRSKSEAWLLSLVLVPITSPLWIFIFPSVNKCWAWSTFLKAHSLEHCIWDVLINAPGEGSCCQAYLKMLPSASSSWRCPGEGSSL